MLLTPERVLYAYSLGAFPMADPDEENAIYWYAPDPRAIVPLDVYRIPRSTRKIMARNTFSVTTDHDFEAVIQGCAARDSTWISPEIIRVYTELHYLGFAHSMECWRAERLVGGIYGIALGGAFFGESMFMRESYASKVALAHLLRRLKQRGYRLFDVQVLTNHLERFGAIEITRSAYMDVLNDALSEDVRW